MLRGLQRVHGAVLSLVSLRDALFWFGGVLTTYAVIELTWRVRLRRVRSKVRAANQSLPGTPGVLYGHEHTLRFRDEVTGLESRVPYDGPPLNAPRGGRA